jgi:diguanylate cyclase (GGDEF)-like protein/PAS domain S-box-containing protein
MREIDDGGSSSDTLAYRALLITGVLALAGSGLGVIGILFGNVAGTERVLVLFSLLFALGALTTLLFFRNVALQAIATACTVYYAANLCAGSLIAAFGSGEHLNLFVYLLWFFPLLVFNKLVNQRVIGKLLAKILLVAPVLMLCCLFTHLMGIFGSAVLGLLGVYCLSYICYAAMLNIATRYREEYIIERERAESLKLHSQVLESISDCFISLDSESRLIYLNDAACSEFAVDRRAALKTVIPTAVPGFFSSSMQAGLRAAFGKARASMFEAQNENQNLWYEVRCFPRADGMSVYFRNVTESVSSRRKLDEANGILREQAELLDKAQDAIFVQDMDSRVVYWNKSAERLYGWTAEEVRGRRIGDIFKETLAELNEGVASVLKHGEWDGELSQRHRNGSVLIVESRCTLVRKDDGTPRSILAINTDITNRKAAEARIQHLAFYDVLTELPNRRLLRERLDTALEAAVRRGNMGALLFIDLDDFKTLNDTLGHDTGDLLLRQVALRLTSCVRARDTVARFGGDEFVVILEALSEHVGIGETEAKAVAGKILAALIQPYQLGNCEYNGTGSVGIALFPGWSDTADDLLKRADLALYRVKVQGGNAMCFFDPAMQTQFASRAALKADLRKALKNRQFELHYQPQVDVNGYVTGAEALLRWRHPRGGMVPPSEFIPLAEEAGLIMELGRWVLQTACSRLARWAPLPQMERIGISVNVSLRQFLDSNFVTLVEEVLRESGANPRRLKIEITESSVMEKVDDTIAKMTALKVHGVSFSLDDFGMGYSSLSHLRRLPLDQVKIDQSFVKDVVTNVKDASIARTIITLGRNLNLSVIAEGVETREQREFLENEGCYAYQGYLFSDAVAPPQFEAFVAAAMRREHARSVAAG